MEITDSPSLCAALAVVFSARDDLSDPLQQRAIAVLRRSQAGAADAELLATRAPIHRPQQCGNDLDDTCPVPSTILDRLRAAPHVKDEGDATAIPWIPPTPPPL